MHRVFYSLLIAAILLTSVPANSVTVIYNGSGYVIGINDLTVGSDQYNVSFVQDSFDDIWPDPEVPTFWQSETGYDAVVAINDVLNSNGISSFYGVQSYYHVPYDDHWNPANLSCKYGRYIWDASGGNIMWYAYPPPESPDDGVPFNRYTDWVYAKFEVVHIHGAFADAGPDKIICNEICDKVVLDSRKSYDANGEIVSYEWELDHDDDLCDKPASGETPTVTDLCPGTYNVTLTITDNDGFTDTDEMVLTVLETCDPCSIMQGDFDSDGDVDGDDLRIFSEHFGTYTLTP